MKRVSLQLVLVLAAAAAAAPPVLAQAPLPATAAPSYDSAELDRIVSPIALYPDPLLAQVLAAATYPSDIQDAARWADDHHYLTGTRLTDAIAADHLPWDPSVQALLPFPSVLRMMGGDMPWTEELGNAFLAQHADVMDAVQRMRQTAERYGYLRSNSQMTVSNGPYIDIEPLDAAYIPVPYYDPLIVFAPPRPGFVVGTAIHVRSRVWVGATFAPWGWGFTRFAWPSHSVIINRVPWGRTWSNRTTYVHPYAVPRYAGPRAPERHRLVARAGHERAVSRSSRHR
jgi:hypothetical protein